MPSWEEALAAIQGFKRLIRFDAGFAAWFDRSPKGALRSFGLALPVLPLFLVFYFYDAQLRPELEWPLLVGAVGALYVLGWVMFPLLLIAIGRALDRETQAIGAIACYNWFSTALTVVATILKLLSVMGIGGSLPHILINLLIFGALIYRVFSFRVLIGVGYGGAALLTLLDFVLNWSLAMLLLAPLYQPPQA